MVWYGIGGCAGRRGGAVGEGCGDGRGGGAVREGGGEEIEGRWCGVGWVGMRGGEGRRCIDGKW